MRLVYTGKGYIPFLSLLAIWSLSLVVDLPGLAISPVLDVISTVFPGATHLEVQLLSVLPNFCIFPFILLSGKLSVSGNKPILVALGLSIFLIAGIGCFFAKSILWLIVFSCVLGMGCGLVIPLAAGFLADSFVGRYRLEQMGIKSGIANFSLVIATLFVGLTEGGDWHTPFIVYLTPVVPLLLSVFLAKKFMNVKTSETGKEQASEPAASKPRVTLSRSVVRRRIWGIIGFYLAVTVSGIVLSFYIPFLMGKHQMGDTATGYVSALFYLMLSLPGLFLGRIVSALRKTTIPVAILLMVIGPLLVAFIPTLPSYLAGASMMGFGYGTLQPVFYDKATELAPSAGSTKVLSYVMAANYFGVAVCPFLFSGLDSSVAAFVGSAVLMAIVFVIAIVGRKWFVFSVDDELSSFSQGKHI